MKKAAAIFILVLCIVLSLNVLAFAETSENAVTKTVENEVENTAFVPISVERKNIDGTEYVIKVYDTPNETKPSELIEVPFEDENFMFEYQSTDKKVNENKETKEISEESTANSQSKKLEDVIKLFPSTKPYDSAGYKGTLNLDTGSIVTEVAGYTTKSYTVSTVKEYPGLMYADASYVSQSAVKDGYTLPLSDVNWVVMATGLSGDSLVPTEYKATATYSKNFSTSVPTGYVSKAKYSGTVEKITEGTSVYTLTYIGRPVVAQKTGMPTALKVVSIIVILLLFAGLIVFLVWFLRNRNGTDIYNFVDKEYLCIGHQVINTKEPLIDLNEFEDMIQSNIFRFVLDEKTTKAMFGRNVPVTYKDVTIKHMVNQKNGEYQFDLDLGGVLDAE